jgi:hypothetical protein
MLIRLSAAVGSRIGRRGLTPMLAVRTRPRPLVTDAGSASPAATGPVAIRTAERCVPGFWRGVLNPGSPPAGKQRRGLAGVGGQAASAVGFSRSNKAEAAELFYAPVGPNTARKVTQPQEKTRPDPIPSGRWDQAAQPDEGGGLKPVGYAVPKCEPKITLHGE